MSQSASGYSRDSGRTGCSPGHEPDVHDPGISDYYALVRTACSSWSSDVSTNGSTVDAHSSLSIRRAERSIRSRQSTTQRKIAAILSAYDDLIENNNRRIKLLEEMVQRIYREWFVDFRYPGHEDVPLVDSELGPIPRGWDDRQRLRDASPRIRRATQPQRSDTAVDGLPMPFSQLDMTSRAMESFDCERIKRSIGECRRVLASTGDILYRQVLHATQSVEFVARPYGFLHSRRCSASTATGPASRSSPAICLAGVRRMRRCAASTSAIVKALRARDCAHLQPNRSAMRFALPVSCR